MRQMTSEDIIGNFIFNHPQMRIKSIALVPEREDLEIYFLDSDDRWSITEFEPESYTREILEDLLFVLLRDVR